MKKQSILSLITLSALGLFIPILAHAADSKLDKADEAFVMKAAQGGMVEVKLGELAKEKAKKEDVKKFGERMVTDHTKANDELKALATSKGVTIPDSLDEQHAAMVTSMYKLEGADFDKAYVPDMVKDHKEDIADFEKEEKSAKDPDLKAFVTKTLPTLKAHLKHIKGVEKK